MQSKPPINLPRYLVVAQQVLHDFSLFHSQRDMTQCPPFHRDGVIIVIKSVFRSRESQLARVTRSYARLGPTPLLRPLRAYTAVLQLLLGAVCSTGFCFLAIRRSCSRSTLVCSRMPICCRSVSRVSGRPVLGRPRYPLSPSVWKYADIAWFAGGCSSKRRTWSSHVLHNIMHLFGGTVTGHTISRCLSSVACESR